MLRETLSRTEIEGYPSLSRADERYIKSVGTGSNHGAPAIIVFELHVSIKPLLSRTWEWPSSMILSTRVLGRIDISLWEAIAAFEIIPLVILS